MPKHQTFVTNRQSRIRRNMQNSRALTRKHPTDRTTMHKNRVNHVDNKNAQPTYCGVMTKPLANEDKVIQPKLNRKIGEAKNQLKQRSNELKYQKKSEKTERHRKKKLKKETNKPKEIDDEEILESRHRRKMKFILSEENLVNITPVKKTKWFIKQ